VAPPTKTIFSSIIMNIIGVLGFLLSPLIVGHLVDGYNLSTAQAGYFIAFLMLGIMLSSITMFLIGVRLNQKLVRALALLVGALGYIMIGVLKDYYLLICLAAITGFAGGLLSSANFVFLSTTEKVSRNLSILMFLMTGVGAISLLGITQISSFFGSESIFFTFSIMHLLALPLVIFIEPVLKAVEVEYESVIGNGGNYSNKTLPWLCLIMFFFTYVAIGAFWPYAERLGITAGLSPEKIGVLLGFGLILTLLGCIVASCLAEHKGYNRPLSFALLVLGFIFIFLGFSTSPYTYVICILIFYFLWNMIDIFELGVLSSVAKEGRYVALAVALQAFGAMIGPMLGASLLAADLPLSAVMYTGAICICAVLALLVYVDFRQMRRVAMLHISPEGKL